MKGQPAPAQMPSSFPPMAKWAGVAILAIAAIGGYVLVRALLGLRTEIASVADNQAAIQKDLQELKTLLRRQPAGEPAAPANPVIYIADARAKGAPDAALTLVEFSDYQ